MADSVKDLIDSSTAARLLGISTGNLRIRIHRGTIPTVRIGAVLLFSRIAIQALKKSSPARAPQGARASSSTGSEATSPKSGKAKPATIPTATTRVRGKSRKK